MSQTTGELLLLYELSLNLGQSLDPIQTGRRFLKTLLSRRNLSTASIWWRDDAGTPEVLDETAFDLLDAIPRGQYRQPRRPLTPLLCRLMLDAQVRVFAAGVPEYAELVSGATDTSVVCAIYPLGMDGLLLLESADPAQFTPAFSDSCVPW
jgi:hypothetical protein